MSYVILTLLSFLMAHPDYHTREWVTRLTGDLVIAFDLRNEVVRVQRLTSHPETDSRLFMVLSRFNNFSFAEGEAWPTLHALRPECEEGASVWDACFIRMYGGTWQDYSVAHSAELNEKMGYRTFYRRKPGVFAREKAVVEEECRVMLRGGLSRAELATRISEALKRQQRPSYMLGEPD